MNSEYDSMHPNQPSNSRPTRPEWSEDVAKHGLAVLNYPEKWKKAQEMSKRTAYYTGTYADCSYWERVHHMFLELGGCRIDQLLPYQQKAYGIVAPVRKPVEPTVAASAEDQEFGGSDELKEHLHQFWADELAHDLTKAGM